MPNDERTEILFSGMYDFFEKQQRKMKQILRHNPEDGMMIASLRKAIREQTYAMLLKAHCPVVAVFPQEMIAEHYANISYMSRQWLCHQEQNKRGLKKPVFKPFLWHPFFFWEKM